MPGPPSRVAVLLPLLSAGLIAVSQGWLRSTVFLPCVVQGRNSGVTRRERVNQL